MNMFGSLINTWTKRVPASQTNPCNLASSLEESYHGKEEDTAGGSHLIKDVEM